MENNSNRTEKRNSTKDQVLMQKIEDKLIGATNAIEAKNEITTLTTAATTMTLSASHMNASTAFDSTARATATTIIATDATAPTSSTDIKNITTNREHNELNAAYFKQRYNVKNAITSPIAIVADTMPLRRLANTNNNNNNNNNVKDIFKTNVKAIRYDGNDGNELIYNRLISDYNHNNNNNKRSLRNFNTLSSQTRDQPFKWMPDSNQLIIEDYGSDYKQQTVFYGQGDEEKNKINENERKRKQQKQQQCLEYLGDSDKTMPKHLCNLKSPGELLPQLRQLRLKNCCERNVYSALHTLALNITLSGGNECEQLLNHIMELDALAARITCGLSNILYRFDCRQVYSIIHQCDDCKECIEKLSAIGMAATSSTPSIAAKALDKAAKQGLPESSPP
ncbi:hypothetical protein GQX74_010699 [Glossina fuscipes]|nr:hypothetical protein GQX74_010699 [Glossina fuscipes]